MLKKNLKLINIILFICIVAGCKKQKNNINSADAESTDAITVIDNKLDITSEEFLRNLRLKEYNKCKFNFSSNQFQIENKSLDTIKIIKSEFNDIDFLKCKINNLELVDCKFKEIEILNSMLESISFERVYVDKLIINTSSFKDIKISSPIEDTIQKITIINCNNSTGLHLYGYIKEIEIEGGQISNLDITKIKNSDCKISIVSTLLIHPNLLSSESIQPKTFLNTSLENAQFNPEKSSMLWEEINVNSLNTDESYQTRRINISKKYIYLRTAYNHLSKIFSDQKKYDLADYFDYRAKVCDRKINSNRFYGFLTWLFHEKMRGNYGTDSFIVLVSIFFIFIFFTFIYFTMGYFNFAFGYFAYTKLSGELLELEKPKIITMRRNFSQFITYLKHCFLYSLNQMILGGISKDFHLYQFSISYLFPPRRYGPVGFGRFVSLMQNIIGLLMLFFLITAFLRLNR